MDRLHLLLLGFPVFLFCSDLVSLFTPPPTSPSSKPHMPRHHQPQSRPVPQVPDFAAVQGSQVRGSGYDSVVELKFCVSCSYRGTAVNMKNMLEASFPGIEVILSNYPPPLPKRIASKVVPVAQVGLIAIIVAGEHIFPRLGMAPPPWYYSLRANRFGAIASTWLLGNFLQSSLQSSGAFEVYCNGELVFSKLKEQRFPGEIELRQLIGNKLPAPAFGKNLDVVWS
ncbi:selT-like protein [Phalaenopsis equestris]|uniref:selT-like protein n=1 Tax=Phalaenopsis equestris TaxID=78828 RepID=UPI0009E2BC40|nr:selT-like protein [Phalaenopsis equestris]